MITPRMVGQIAKINPTVRLVVFVAGVIGLGVSIAFLLISPFQEPVISVFWTLFFLVVIAISPLNGLLFWLISHPVTEILVNIKLGESIPDLSLARLCIGFLLLLVLAQTAIGRRKIQGITKIEISILLFVIGFGASMVNVLTPANMLQFLFDTWTLPLIIYFLVKNLVTDRQKLHRMLQLLLIVGVYSALYMFYELHTGNILFLPGRLSHQFYEDSSLRIVRGLYGTTLVFGLLFNWLLPIAVYYFLKAPTMFQRVLYGFIAGLMFAGDLFTYKRTTWVALVVSFLLMQWFYPQLRRFFLVLLVLFVVVLVFTWDSVSQSELATKRALNEDEWNSANGRTDRWSEGWSLWLQKPLFGHGFRKYNQLAEHQNVENDYLHILVSSGLAGFVPYMAFFIFVLMDSIKVFRQIGTNKTLFVDQELMVVFWGLYSTYFITAFASSGIDGHSMGPLTFFAIIGAIVGSQTSKLKQSRRSQNWLPA